MKMKAYFYEESSLNPHSPNDSGELATLDDLRRIGVNYRHQDEDLVAFANQIMEEFAFRERDEVVISRKTFGDAYDAKLATFFEEHLHEDDESRLILDGEGFFDVRSADDRWIRVLVEKGDLLVLPAGLYHRFTTTEKHYTHAMRLFLENPKWIALPRTAEAEKSECRQAYLRSIQQ
ncbi:acireductone dioxygenase family protein [Schizosaccharomyces japonicus yFS275]|uniref:Acireductone dioxygenase n=1 Tax=Schizosaccharomyces japonicus (strain yFS275 / FY16936) TaxID=402676 RepID=B6JVA2_SCHJY|nr:acireductone dioxygenase family protein [Schizosaccharomyces japonicus yFS275]EEB05303.1 acireductone dioxygenase family protein [Schizosaccharomyces japonicus yFS275]